LGCHHALPLAISPQLVLGSGELHRHGIELPAQELHDTLGLARLHRPPAREVPVHDRIRDLPHEVTVGVLVGDVENVAVA